MKGAALAINPASGPAERPLAGGSHRRRSPCAVERGVTPPPRPHLQVERPSLLIENMKKQKQQSQSDPNNQQEALLSEAPGAPDCNMESLPQQGEHPRQAGLTWQGAPGSASR